jgi:hypothetical protein
MPRRVRRRERITSRPSVPAARTKPPPPSALTATMNIQVYQVIHVLSGFLLTAVTFQAFASPSPGRRKRTLMYAGILALLMLVAGFGLAAKLGLNIGKESWIHVKILCWVTLSAMAGLAFRMPSLGRVLSLITVIAVALAIYMVYVGRTVV